LKNYPKLLIEGIDLAMCYLQAESAYIYLNHSYYHKYAKKLADLAGKKNIRVFQKPLNGGYVGGEETAVLNAIEGKKIEPRLKPPYPSACGLWSSPTLINNIETFYQVAKINRGQYKQTRLYTVSGDCINDGVYELPIDLNIEEILRKTNNFPDYDFFVQSGGGASGEFYNQKQLNRPVSGSAAIIIYSYLKHHPMELLKKLASFFAKESCGQCTPCREGTYRLKEQLFSGKPDWQMIGDLLDNLGDSSFCGLGCVVPVPFRTFAVNILPNMPEKGIGLSGETKKIICECFK